MVNEGRRAYPAEASREMMDAGVFYGRKKSKTNPKMRQFVIANRGGIEIINLQKTEELMDEAAAFIKEKVRNNGSGVARRHHPGGGNECFGAREEFNFPYVTFRWVGGAITNFKIIENALSTEEVRTDFASGALARNIPRKNAWRWSAKCTGLKS